MFFKNDLHVFYHSCPNKKSPRPSPEFTKRLFVSGFGVFKGIYLEIGPYEKIASLEQDFVVAVNEENKILEEIQQEKKN